MTTETQTPEELFQAGLKRYQEGEEAAVLIPIFQKICDRQPKVASSWICLSWLYLLDQKSALAYKTSLKAVKLSPEDPQARINLAIAMLETSQKGVREHIEAAQNWMMILKDMKAEIVENFEEGKRRRPDWKELERVQNWVFENIT
jgi:tetratricopeptide (TPR) repeat protein